MDQCWRKPKSPGIWIPRGQAQGQLFSWGCVMVVFSHRKEHEQSQTMLYRNPVTSEMLSSKLLDAEHLLFHFPNPHFVYCKPGSSPGPRPRLSPLAAEPSLLSVPHLVGGRFRFWFASSSTPVMLRNWRDTGMLWGAQRLLAGKVTQACPMGMPCQGSFSTLGFTFLFGLERSAFAEVWVALKSINWSGKGKEGWN